MRNVDLVPCNNEELGMELSRIIGDEYNFKIGTLVVNAVHGSLVNCLCVDSSEIVSGARLVGDLGAESIDGLDICYRIEKQLQIGTVMSSCNMLIKGKGHWEEEIVDKENTVLNLTRDVYKYLKKERNQVVG